jgi:hypothetical protein
MSPGETVPYPASPMPTRALARSRTAKLPASPEPTVAMLQMKMLRERTHRRGYRSPKYPPSGATSMYTKMKTDWSSPPCAWSMCSESSIRGRMPAIRYRSR